MQHDRSYTILTEWVYHVSHTFSRALAEASRYFRSEAIAEAYVNQIDLKNRIT